MSSTRCVRFLVLAVCSCVVNGQYTMSGPSTATEGSTVTFTCTTSPVQIAVIWREMKGASTSEYSSYYDSTQGQCQTDTTGTIPSGYNFSCDSTSGVFTLSFPVDYSRHSGSVWRCLNAGGTGEGNNITLSVTVPLTSVILLNTTNSPLTLIEGTDVTLVCETNPTDPVSTISWRRDGQLVTQGVTTSTRQETGGVVTVSVLSRTVQWTDRGVYSCEALNSGVTRTSQDLTIAVQVSSVTLTNITINNQEVPVNQDSSLVLTCQTSPAYPAPTVTWYVRSSMTSSGVTSRTETLASGQSITVSTMTRTLGMNNDQDTFYCEAENINGVAGKQTNTARANVFYGPDANMVTLIKPSIVAERNEVTLTCKTLTPVNPEVDFTWSYGDNTAITSGLGIKQGEARGVWSQTLRVGAERDSNRQEIICDVINTETRRSERVVVDLDVSYGPDSGEVQVSKSSPAVELKPLSLTCSTTNNVKPGVTFTWTVDGLEVTSGTGVIRGSSGSTWSQTLTLTPTRGQSSVGCTVINTAIARQDSSSVDLYVNYLDRPHFTMNHTNVREGESVRLECSTRSHPTAELTVRNVDNDTVIVQENTDDLLYNIRQAQCLHSGSFVCSAANEEIGVLYSPIIQLNVLCDPRLDTRKPLKRNVSTGIDEIASLLLNVISNPAPTFHWYLSDNEQLVPIPNITKHEIISTARYSVLQIHVTHVRDYASYVVEATSNIGTFTMRFNLLPTTSASSQAPLSDRLGLGVGIGIAAVLPIVVIELSVIVGFMRRNSHGKKGAEANQESQIEMTSWRYNGKHA